MPSALGMGKEEVFYLFGIRKEVRVLAVVGVLVLSSFLIGCGAQQPAGGRPTQVKAMNVLCQDTPLTYVYAGQIAGTDEVKIQSRVSGI